MNREFNYSASTILMFIILILLTGGLMVERSRLAIIPLVIGVLYGARILMKYLEEGKDDKK